MGYILFDHKRNKELMDNLEKQLHITPIIDFITQYSENRKEHTQNNFKQDTKNYFWISTKRKEMFVLNPQKMDRNCYVMAITDHKAYTGKEKYNLKFLLIANFFYNIKYSLISYITIFV